MKKALTLLIIGSMLIAGAGISGLSYELSREKLETEKASYSERDNMAVRKIANMIGIENDGKLNDAGYEKVFEKFRRTIDYPYTIEEFNFLYWTDPQYVLSILDQAVSKI
jgi:hypothetical protein